MNFWKLIAVLIFSAHLNSLAQSQNPIERVNQRTDRVGFFDVLEDPNGNWIISGQANPSTNIQAPLYFVQSVDGSGELNWDYGHSLMPNTWDAAEPQNRDKFVLLPDGSVVLAGLQDGCDFITGISSLLKLTPSGNLDWSIDFGGEEGYEPERVFDRLATNPTDKIAIASSDTVMIFSDTGDLVNKWKITSPPTRCLTWESDTTLLIAVASKFFRMKTDGAAIDSISISNSSFGIDIHRSANEIWVMTQNSIHIIDEQFQPVADVDLTSLTGAELELVDVDGETWVTDGIGIWSVSPQHTLNNELLYDYDVNATEYNDGIVMTVSTVEQNNRTAGLMKSYLLDGTSIEHSDDVELLVTLDSTDTNAGFQSGPEPIFVHWASLTPRIVNHSQDSLYKVMVSYSEQYLPGFCGKPGVSIVEETAELGYLDTLTFEFPPFRVGYYGPFTGDSTLTYSICIVAQSPNDHLDVFPSDNVWCQDLEFVLPLSIQEQKGQELKVYPNPTTGIVHLPPIENLSWQLFDATGRLVGEGDGNSTLDLSTFGASKNLYLLKLRFNNSESTIRLVHIE